MKLLFALLLLGVAGVSALVANSGIKRVILFDGVCNFCNKWVDTVLSLDKKKQFKFAALQTEAGRNLLESLGKHPDDLSSVIYIRSLDPLPDFYTKSDAALKVAEDLGMPSFLTFTAFALIPKTVRDNVYDMIATNRYSILGRREESRCGDTRYSDRFL
ncbi:DUF393 domain-containing protein [archaeon]|nr:MAG: DUF393 domain-containing protein [archaeon]